METQRHVFTRVRHPLAARELQVKRVTELTPRMRRITLQGSSLKGFTSLAPDDHVKLFIPWPGETHPRLPDFASGVPSASADVMARARDYTPRRYDAESGELDIDFVLHGDGPASTWAAQAETGQWLGVAGPRGSMVPPNDFDAYVLAGDETALPSIARRLEELPAGARVIVLAEIADAAEEQALPATAEVHWLHRGSADYGSRLEETLRGLPLPAGDCYIWVATESKRTQAIRRMLTEERGHPQEWIKAAGYWQAEDGSH